MNQLFDNTKTMSPEFIQLMRQRITDVESGKIKIVYIGNPLTQTSLNLSNEIIG